MPGAEEACSHFAFVCIQLGQSNLTRVPKLNGT